MRFAHAPQRQTCSAIGTLLCIASAAVNAAVVVENGQPRGTIVVPEDATPSVRFAAQELARYLEQIGGATLPVVDEAGGTKGVAVHVGPTDAAKVRIGVISGAISMAPITTAAELAVRPITATATLRASMMLNRRTE